MTNIKNSIDAVNMLNEIKQLRDNEGNASHRNGLEQALAILEDREPEYLDTVDSEPINEAQEETTVEPQEEPVVENEFQRTEDEVVV